MVEISNEEFERYKRYQAEQYKALGLQIVELKNMIGLVNPGTPMAPKTKDLLARQVDMMFKKIHFIETELLKIKKKIGMT